MREARSVGPPVRDSNPKSPVNTFRRFFVCHVRKARPKRHGHHNDARSTRTPRYVSRQLLSRPGTLQPVSFLYVHRARRLPAPPAPRRDARGCRDYTSDFPLTLFADSAIGVVSRASRARCRPSGTPPSRSWPIAARRTARAKKRDAPRTPSLPPPPTLTPSDPILATRHGISRHQPS